MTARRLASAALLAVVAATAVLPRLPAAGAEDGPAAAPSSSAGIQWFATWTGGTAEAKRTGRPILLVSAAPHCHGISGLW